MPMTKFMLKVVLDYIIASELEFLSSQTFMSLDRQIISIILNLILGPSNSKLERSVLNTKVPSTSKHHNSPTISRSSSAFLDDHKSTAFQLTPTEPHLIPRPFSRFSGTDCITNKMELRCAR